MGEIELSPEAQTRLLEGKKKVDEISELVGNLSPSQPGTWIKFVSRTMEYTFDSCRSYDSNRKWLRGHGYSLFRCDLVFLLKELLDEPGVEVVFSDSYGDIYQIPLPNGARLCIVRDPERSRERMDVYARWELDGLEKVMEGMSEVFWRARKAVVLDVNVEGMNFQEKELESYAYKGSLLNLIEQWERYREMGIRRNVLLQGRPGCGKSTFCFHAAHRLSKRTMLLTSEFCSEVRATDWALMLAVLRPEMVIVDDVDRVGGSAFETKLRMFEEGYCEIPFVLFTSNDHTRLPRAMRRPGRIDQIIMVDEPDENVRMHIIEEMASRVGVSIPVEALPRLDALLLELSAAHVVEALRRAKVEGWESEMAGGDVTFDIQETPRAKTGLRLVGSEDS